MNKKMVPAFVLLMCVVTLSGCTSEQVPIQEDSESAEPALDTEPIQDIQYTKPPLESLTEYEKYALFEAENACLLMSVRIWDSGESDNAAAKIHSIVERYDFSNADLELLRQEHRGDNSFEFAVIKFMKELCPEYIDGFVSYDGSEIGDTSSLTEKERYALFGADGVCYYAGVRWWDQEDVDWFLSQMDALPEKHGIPYDDVLLLKEKYADDESFDTLFIEAMKTLCPDSIGLLNN